MVRALLTGVAEQLGSELVSELRAYVAERFAHPQGGRTTLTVTPREIDLFLTNGPYAQFVADKVIRNACTRFAMLPEDERRSVFAIALLHGSDAAGVVREIVAYMRNRP